MSKFKTKKPKMCRVSITLDSKDWRTLAKIAYQSGNSIQSTIRHLLWEYTMQAKRKNLSARVPNNSY